MAYNGHVTVVHPDARNLESILRDGNAQNIPIL